MSIFINCIRSFPILPPSIIDTAACGWGTMYAFLCLRARLVHTQVPSKPKVHFGGTESRTSHPLGAVGNFHGM